MKKPPSKSHQRAEAIMRVCCGQMTASQAAVELGVSRKTDYKWEQRGLTGLLTGVCDQRVGRPEKPDQELALEKQLADTLRENQRWALKDLGSKINIGSGMNRTKKK